MKNLLLLFVLGILLTSCKKEEKEVFNAIVIDKGMDCGNSYLIKFNEDVSGLPENAFGNIFYEINLPEEFKVKERKIKVTFRKPSDDEQFFCTTMGPSYSLLYIIKAE